MATQSGAADTSQTPRTGSSISSGGESAHDTENALSRDDVFDLLSNRRRRWTLHALEQHDERVDLRALSTRVAAWENRKPVEMVTNTERRRVYTSLQQFHLPKLHENGVVSYDEQAGSVALTSVATDLDVYLDVVANGDIPWSRYYVGLAGLGLACVAGAWLGIYPFSVLPDLTWALGIVIAFGVSAMAHVHQNRRAQLGTPGTPPELRDP